MSKRELTVLFIPCNFVGPVLSCVGLGQVLLEAGHRVVFAVWPEWQQKVQTFGSFQVEVVGDDDETEHQEVNTSNDGNNDVSGDKSVELSKDFLGNQTPFYKTVETFKDILDTTVERVKYYDPYYEEVITRVKPDVIITSDLLTHPSIIKSKIPWIYVYTSNPLSLDLAIEDNSLPPSFLGIPTDTDQTDYQVIREKLKDTLRPGCSIFADWLRKQQCPAPVGCKLWPESPYANLYMFPKELDYTSIRQLPDTYHQFDYFMRQDNLDQFEIPQSLRDKPGKLVYFSLGSMGSANVPLMERLIKILAKSQHRFIVSKGIYHDQYELAENMWGARSVPQTQVLPLVDLVITHGGNNTVTEGLFYGKPMIVLPIFWDQFDNAQRLDELGFGRRLNPYECSQSELLDAVEGLLTDTQLANRLMKMSQRIQREKSLHKVTNIVETICK